MRKTEGVLWIVFGLLWVAAVLAGIENVRHGEDPVLRLTGRGSYEHYWFFLLAYLIGGAVVAMVHSKWVEKLPGASFSRGETATGARFDTVPAPKFFAMWLTGAVGIVLVLSLPYAVFGYGIALLFCIGFGGLLILMAFVPKLWRRGTPRTFTVSSAGIEAAGTRLAVDSASAFSIGNTLRYKPYNVPSQIEGRMSSDLRHNVYYAPGGNPLAAQGLAGVHDTGIGIVNAIGNGLGELAHRYYIEMRARSWQLKLRSGGKDHVLADGLDGGSAEVLLNEVNALIGARAST
jgi:hypothetical protein